MADPNGYVYFIREGAAGSIKIGTTQGSPHGRLRSMQTGNSSDLVLLAAIPGDAGLEKRLHERFAALRIRGEWFQATSELLAFIEGVSLAHPIPPPGSASPLEAMGLLPEQIEFLADLIDEHYARLGMADAEVRLVADAATGVHPSEYGDPDSSDGASDEWGPN